MPPRYEHRFQVRSYEVGADAEVRPDTYLNYLEEAGVRASASLGYDFNWYAINKRLWVARKLFIEYYHPARLNDEISITTWISETRRVQAYRKYEMRRATDNELLLRARHMWVYLNAETLLPTRMPAEFAVNFDPDEASDPTQIDMANLVPLAMPSPNYHMDDDRVRYAELDQNKHVNNAVYVQWSEQAINQLLRAKNWPPDRWQAGAMQRLARETDYLRSLQDAESFQISTSIQAVDADRVLWLTDICYKGTSDSIAQDRLLCRVSPELRESLLE
jgi:YbgC/YbaW family acyl-CoA thioester hydrolase